MKLELFQIDAFTNKLFGGNSAGVILLDEWLDEYLMQKIAIENNISETAFIKLENGVYNIRWFSPISEIDFCGHATLASAYVIFNNHNLEQITFRAQAVGDLEVEKQEDGYIKMTFPIREGKVIDKIPNEILKGLNRKPKEVLLNNQAYIVVFDNEADVHEIKVDLEKIKKLAPYDVVVTASSTKYDFVSRYFWPANGGDEDPVTGSMHTGLVPYWAKKLNKNNLIAYQASKRGGFLKCELTKNNVIILGKAVQYLKGTIEI